ncbi:sensor histidine kinase [Knoellia subterranea]|uniref:Signal transduction histidine-protein kinase/phosphatase MprB n=1 Tax=Knoellia subterranea KCTC 19937 TaxID=1385521 RepID=A0A0A0JIF1_9MICO|nr:HAMP domain-containing sensor histidine kinase [Knoellia subterranea]KGN36903.1 histidine kinase [Knoellia subterranea KCTC 19937]
MRRLLLRSTLAAVVATLAIFGGPLLVLGLVVALLPSERRARIVDTTSGVQGVLILTGVVLALSLLGLAVGYVVAQRRSRALGDPLTELAARAERLGAGESRFMPLNSGIGELDRISDVLSRSATQVTRNLAAERDFAADASHQLRTPLTALLMRLDEIASTDDLTVVQEEAQVAIGQVERLSKVVDDLMGRTRVSDPSRPSVSLDAVLASLQREWQPAFAATKRSMRIHGERGLRVRATPVALAQIVSTLIENALAHGRGTVDIAARRAGPSVVIELGDEGTGVSPGIAPHIFERSVSSSGSGLGLTLARDLAEDNGGRLELVSTQPAVFAVFLSEADD